jgi:hypothetical protein
MRVDFGSFEFLHTTGSIGKPVNPDPRDVKGFAEFFARHKKGLAIEREAVKSLK